VATTHTLNHAATEIGRSELFTQITEEDGLQVYEKVSVKSPRTVLMRTKEQKVRKAALER
jgi:hypothetical protein